MPIEIRELVIKTSLESRLPVAAHEAASLEALRREILAQCERMLREHQARKHLER